MKNELTNLNTDQLLNRMDSLHDLLKRYTNAHYSAPVDILTDIAQTAQELINRNTYKD